MGEETEQENTKAITPRRTPTQKLSSNEDEEECGEGMATKSKGVDSSEGLNSKDITPCGSESPHRQAMGGGEANHRVCLQHHIVTSTAKKPTSPPTDEGPTMKDEK